MSAMFVQGTTPTHTFRLSIDTDTITRCRISYAQADKIVVEKNRSGLQEGREEYFCNINSGGHHAA